MVRESPAPGRAAQIDLLVVGGLTVDELAGGATEPGGSVLHATRAATAAGLRVGAVTLAGPEPAARRGVDELRRRADILAVAEAASTITFRHHEDAGGRELTLLDRGARLAVELPDQRPAAILYAAVAGELDPEGMAHPPEGTACGALLQGWLRSVAHDGAVRPVPLGALAPEVTARLAAMDLLVASVEDLAGGAAPAGAQLAVLRAAFGAHPVLALTLGSRGALLEHGGERVEVGPPRIVDGATTGAGDAFAAILLHRLASGDHLADAGEVAAWETVRFLRRRTRRRYAVGDVHGERERLVAMLAAEGLTNAGGAWTGGTAELWFLGDLVDRGADGIGVIDLVRRLADEAAGDGGAVRCLLGNHEMALLAAHLMPGALSTGPGRSMRADWIANGGRQHDLDRLTPDHVRWLRTLPAMALVDDDLLVHADSTVYVALGASVGEVNERIRRELAAPSAGSWDGLLARFSERFAFRDATTLDAFLDRFGGSRVIHGHTPVPAQLDLGRAGMGRPYVYGSGRAVASDPGFVLGGPGFVVEL